MINIAQMFEYSLNVIQSLTNDEKHPLHVGEVMACWTYLSFVENILIYEEIGSNTTTDSELKTLFQDAIEVATSHIKQLSKFMRDEGVSLPISPEHKPTSDPSAIPLGAKFTDDELINAVNINFVIAMDLCASAASQCLRTDVGMIFLKFQTDKLALGFKSKKLMKEKGWLKVPPYYLPPGSPNR